MRLWIDDCCPAPEGYLHATSVYKAKAIIVRTERRQEEIELIDIDYDAGAYFQYGGEYIELLIWLEETKRSYPIHIHSTNPEEIKEMRRIIKRNRWKERK